MEFEIEPKDQEHHQDKEQPLRQEEDESLPDFNFSFKKRSNILKTSFRKKTQDRTEGWNIDLLSRLSDQITNNWCSLGKRLDVKLPKITANESNSRKLLAKHRPISEKKFENWGVIVIAVVKTETGGRARLSNHVSVQESSQFSVYKNLDEIVIAVVETETGGRVHLSNHVPVQNSSRSFDMPKEIKVLEDNKLLKEKLKAQTKEIQNLKSALEAWKTIVLQLGAMQNHEHDEHDIAKLNERVAMLKNVAGEETGGPLENGCSSSLDL